MSNPIVRIALVNLSLAFVFAGLFSLELPYFSWAAGALVAVAVLVNVTALISLRRSKKSNPPEPMVSAPASRLEIKEGSLGRTRATTGSERRPPKPANRYHDESAMGEMPPWLRMKGNIVMTWNGKHHVAPVNGDDPFEMAQRLYERLRTAPPETEANSAAPASAS